MHLLHVPPNSQKSVKLVFDNLIYRCPFTLCWHTYTDQYCNSRRNVNFTNNTVGHIVFLDVRTGCHEDWRYRSICIALIGGDGVTVDTVEAFFVEVDDIAATIAVQAEVCSFFTTYCERYDTLTISTIVVEVVNNLTF